MLKGDGFITIMDIVEIVLGVFFVDELVKEKGLDLFLDVENIERED